MKDKEKQVFINLCNFKAREFDETLLAYATPSVLGQLFFNRMQAIAYGTLKERGLLGKVNREFRNSLKSAYEQNFEKNQSFFECIRQLNRILSECTCSYAMLKGAFLCRYYPEGYRTSNDVDLLVLPENVTEISNVLKKAGFRQGSIRNGEFVPATRVEIVASKMTRGETIPFIKEIRLPGMRYLEVDINFSLDYKNGDTDVLKKMLNRACRRTVSGLEIQTLESSDFFIHLCGHLHKEATTLPWVEMKRDMTLYKYGDIYALLSDMTPAETESLFIRAKELDMEKVCSFAILQTAAILDVDNHAAREMAEMALCHDSDFLHTVVSPRDKKQLLYREKNIARRFFSDDRTELLKGVQG